jgi:hypothetical protein
LKKPSGLRSCIQTSKASSLNAKLKGYFTKEHKESTKLHKDLYCKGLCFVNSLRLCASRQFLYGTSLAVKISRQDAKTPRLNCFIKKYPENFAPLRLPTILVRDKSCGENRSPRRQDAKIELLHKEIPGKLCAFAPLRENLSPRR